MIYKLNDVVASCSCEVCGTAASQPYYSVYRLTVFPNWHSPLLPLHPPQDAHTHHAGAPKPDLKDLVVLPISDWFSLGDQLNISREELLVIKSNFHHDPQTCKRQMFQCWLISTSQASYHQLVVALKNAGDDSLAEELHIKYGKNL